MTVKEKIYSEIEQMSQVELALLYEQLKWLKRARQPRRTESPPVSIDELHKYTASSKSSWSGNIIMNREDRL